ncbi:hypothetical protein BDV95DRAFT_508350 [Massariosphaeria phaeospora]|uniref:Uncharacterized protein n=1 Tax=Massariosphaeria phaeospora TaxID=100035 RepID=A0A7C8HZT3_9PLEO|nr:hypothetical protein BDV95DRAFT_508350 [Massariosphaeria phaeospora]
MSRATYSAFQKHLQFFCAPRSNPPRLTLLSGLRASVALGLDLPVALALSLGMRLLYAPFPNFLSPIYIDKIPKSKHRNQLATAHLEKGKSEWTCTELLRLLDSSEDVDRFHAELDVGFLERKINQAHIVGFWTMAANTQTHTATSHDVERFQQGDWQHDVAQRRRGREDVLPLWRGGPLWVGGHSWAVWMLLGVKMYEKAT